MNTTIQKILEGFDKEFKCIQTDCDGTGHTRDGEDDGQCQFHAEYIFPLKSYLRSSVALVLEELGKDVEGKKQIEDRNLCGAGCCRGDREVECERNEVLSEVSTLINQWITELRG